MNRSIEPVEQPNAAAGTAVKLITLPYAGAGANCYHALGQALPDFVTPIAYELPGHGTRLREPLLRRCAPLIHDAIERLEPIADSPYAIYGHSFGAWLAVDLARRLVELGRPPPLHLFVSGRRAPSAIVAGPFLHRLPSPAFRARLAEFGGTAPAILADVELMSLFEPILRADLEALETREQQARPPLDVPIHIMVGLDDEITDEQARAWQLETLHPIGLSYFPGGHFALVREQTAELAKLIARDLGGVIERRQR